MAALAAAGLAVSAYLATTKLVAVTALFCEKGSGCDVVQASRYATFLGLPTAAWGVALYAAVVALAVAGFTARRWLAAFVLGVAAVAFSAYLVYLQLAVIRAVCPWCLLDAGIAVVLLALLVWRRPAPRGRRASTRPARVAVIGATVAVVTVVGAIGVHVGDSPTSGSAYRGALATHLAASGAIFYGAYW